jgi:hypothetical protein
MRSASSRALRSASSKSRPSLATTFFAPRPFFFAPRMFFLGAVPEAVLRIAGFAAEGIAAAVVGAESGDLGRAVPFPLAGALRNGDGD